LVRKPNPIATGRDLFKDKTGQTSSYIFPDKFQGLTAGLGKGAGWNGHGFPAFQDKGWFALYTIVYSVFQNTVTEGGV
jgi:hypothetical protein